MKSEEHVDDMKFWFFVSFILIVFAPVPIISQALPLTQLVYGAEKILQARYYSAQGDSLIFLSKDLHSADGFIDTIILLQSQAFAPIALTDENIFRINKKVLSALQRSKELLLFIHHMEGNVAYPIYSGIRISIDDEIRFTNGPLVYEDADFIEMEKINWDEMLQRVLNIETRLNSVYALNEIKNSRRRNKVLFNWLEDHMAEFQQECYFNADCGWGRFQDIVLNWITEARNLEDTWKASIIYRRIYPPDIKSSGLFSGLFMEGGSSFVSEKGILFLFKKALDAQQPVIKRRQALKFMINAAHFTLRDTFQNASYFKIHSQSDRQSELLDKLMPLVYDPQVRDIAFRVISIISHPLAPDVQHRINLKKLPEIIELYKAQPENSSVFKLALADFIHENSTVEQWKSLTGNDAKIYITLHGVYYNKEKQLLRFGIYYHGSESLLIEKPKVHMEKWEGGKITDEIIRDFFNENGSTWKPVNTYIQQVVDIRDLEPGDWVFYLSGVAGDRGQFVWKSEVHRFVKE